MTRRFIATIVIAMSIATACAAGNSQEKAIQGTWHFSQSDGRSLGMSLQWTFDHGSYELKGYPQILKTGRYRVLESKDSTLQLLLYENKGDQPPDDRKISVTVNAGGQALMIDNHGPWTKGRQ
jgi:hypothetical protein